MLLKELNSRNQNCSYLLTLFSFILRCILTSNNLIHGKSGAISLKWSSSTKRSNKTKRKKLLISSINFKKNTSLMYAKFLRKSIKLCWQRGCFSSVVSLENDYELLICDYKNSIYRFYWASFCWERHSRSTHVALLKFFGFFKLADFLILHVLKFFSDILVFLEKFLQLDCLKSLFLINTQLNLLP